MFYRKRSRRLKKCVASHSALIECLENRTLLTAPTVLGPTGNFDDLVPWIEWTPVENAASYNIWLAENGKQIGLLTEHRGTSGGDPDTSVPVSWIVPDRLPNDPLIDGALYRVWVQAVFGDGSTGDWSVNHDFTKPADGFHFPLEFEVSPEVQVTQTPGFEWSEPIVTDGTVERYELFINAIGNQSDPVYHRTDLTERHHQVETPLAFGSYEVWVRAHLDDGSQTRWGSSQKLTLISEAPPEFRPVMEFRAKFDRRYGYDATPVIEWDDAGLPHNLSVDRYDVFINRQGESEAVYRNANVSGDSLEHEVEQPLEANTTYEIWVRAYLADGSKTRWGESGVFLEVNDTYPDIEDIVPVVSVTGGVASWDEITVRSTSYSIRYTLWVNEYDSDGKLIAGRAYHNNALTGVTSQDMGLSAGRYRVWLRAFVANTFEYTQWSEPVDFVI